MNKWVMIECASYSLETEIDSVYLESPDWSGDEMAWLDEIEDYWETTVELNKWRKGK